MSDDFPKMQLPMTIDYTDKTRFRKDILSARGGENVRGKSVEVKGWACLKRNLPAPSTVKPGFFLARAVREPMNRSDPNGWGSPRNLTFSPSTPKTANPKGSQSEARNE